jgi:5-methylcytosine-specific restriction enzyme A
MFEVGEVYNRRADIHKPYGGQWQGDISTPSRWPLIFLFTGESGEQYGYEDGWDENGIFLYTGEGQVGKMDFVQGN